MARAHWCMTRHDVTCQLAKWVLSLTCLHELRTVVCMSRAATSRQLPVPEPCPAL